MATQFILGPGAAQPLLNFFFRGVTPPSLPANLYFSLGVGNATTLAEYSGFVRAAVPRHRGAIGGHSTQSASEYPYQSDGVTTAQTKMLYPCFLRVPSTAGEIPISTTDGLWIMVYDAATAGNLMFASKVDYWASDYTTPQYRANDVLQIHQSMTHPDVTTISSGNTDFPYVHSMVGDWMLRGYDSLTQLFPVASYPDLAMSIIRSSNSIYTESVWVPRNTAVWSAPSAGVEPFSTKITNLVAITSGAFNNAFQLDNNQPLSVEFRLAPPPQVSSMLLHLGAKLMHTRTDVASGDSMMFAIGNLDVIEGQQGS